MSTVEKQADSDASPVSPWLRLADRTDETGVHAETAADVVTARREVPQLAVPPSMEG